MAKIRVMPKNTWSKLISKLVGYFESLQILISMKWLVNISSISALLDELGKVILLFAGSAGVGELA